MQMGILLGWIAHKYLQLFCKCPEIFHTCIGQSRKWNQLAHVLPGRSQCLIWEGSPKMGLTGTDVCSWGHRDQPCSLGKMIPPALLQTTEMDVSDELPHNVVFFFVKRYYKDYEDRWGWRLEPTFQVFEVSKDESHSVSWHPGQCLHC